MRLFSGLVSVVLLVVGANSFSLTWPHWGRCPDLEVQQAFKLDDYMGTWYTQGGYNLAMTQGKGRCSSATYTLDSTPNVVDVYNQQISASTNKWESITGNAVPVDSSKDEGKFTVNLYVWKFWKVTGPYWVLGTDYDTYSVVYGCENVFWFFHYYSSWLLSREQDLDDSGAMKFDFYKDVNATLLSHNIDPSIFEIVDQTNCPS